MDSSNENNVSDVSVTVNRSINLMHFSDGVEEQFEGEQVNELQSVPNSNSENVDTNYLSWGPWLSYYAWRSSTKVLNAVDTVGGSLASFFGITTPKYQLEINEYERLQEEKKKMDEESIGWVPITSGGDVPLVLNEPTKGIESTQQA